MSIIADKVAAERWSRRAEQHHRWHLALVAELKKLAEETAGFTDPHPDRKTLERLAFVKQRGELLQAIRRRHLERCPLPLAELSRAALLDLRKQ